MHCLVMTYADIMEHLPAYRLARPTFRLNSLAPRSLSAFAQRDHALSGDNRVREKIFAKVNDGLYRGFIPEMGYMGRDAPFCRRKPLCCKGSWRESFQRCRDSSGLKRYVWEFLVIICLMKPWASFPAPGIVSARSVLRPRPGALFSRHPSMIAGRYAGAG